ncbi:MAG: hypothetical protein KKE39_05265, partial [Bacteroidetes bacterium]|nr:hypothetical protein [Bacteroidota bacterium]
EEWNVGRMGFIRPLFYYFNVPVLTIQFFAYTILYRKNGMLEGWVSFSRYSINPIFHYTFLIRNYFPNHHASF